jgi:protein TonB
MSGDTGLTIGRDARVRWLRPAALGVVLAAHAAALLAVTLAPPTVPAEVDSLDITIAQAPPAPPAPPDTTPEPPPPPPPPEPAPEVKPDPPPPPPPDTPPPPDPPPVPPPPDPPPQAEITPPEPPVSAEAPKREVADAPAIPLRPKAPPKKLVQLPKPKPPDAAAPPPAAAPPMDAPTVQPAQAMMTYGSKVLQEIRSHRIPSTELGSVVVAFAIDAAGTVVSASVAHSSGSAALDATALRMVRAARPGPPPDGSFSGRTTINFVKE